MWHTHSILALRVLSNRHKCNLPTSTWKQSAEIQGDLGDKSRKCFGTSNSLVTEFVCWKQFWSNSTSKGKGRPRGMGVRDLSEYVQDQHIQDQCGSLAHMAGRERSPKRPWKVLSCRVVLVRRVHLLNGKACPLWPLRGSQRGSWAQLGILSLQLNRTCQEKLSFWFIIPKSLAF